MKSAPGAPTGFTVVRTSSGLKATWSSPSDDGGRAVNAYLLTTEDGTPLAATNQTTADIPWPAETATALLVSAVNDIGIGQPAEATIPTIPTDPSAPPNKTGKVRLKVKALPKSKPLARNAVTKVVRGYRTSEPSRVRAKVLTRPGKPKAQGVRLTRKGKRIWVRTSGAKTLKTVTVKLVAMPKNPTTLSRSVWTRTWKVTRGRRWEQPLGSECRVALDCHEPSSDSLVLHSAPIPHRCRCLRRGHSAGNRSCACTTRWGPLVWDVSGGRQNQDQLQHSRR